MYICVGGREEEFFLYFLIQNKRPSCVINGSTLAHSQVVLFHGFNWKYLKTKTKENFVSILDFCS